MFKLLAESTDLGNVKILSTLKNKNASRVDIIKAVFEKDADIFCESETNIWTN